MNSAVCPFFVVPAVLVAVDLNYQVFQDCKLATGSFLFLPLFPLPSVKNERCKYPIVVSLFALCHGIKPRNIFIF